MITNRLQHWSKLATLVLLCLLARASLSQDYSDLESEVLVISEVNTNEDCNDAPSGNFGNNPQVTQVECYGYSNAHLISGGSPLLASFDGATECAHKRRWKVLASDTDIETYGESVSFEAQVRRKWQAVAHAEMSGPSGATSNLTYSLPEVVERFLSASVSEDPDKRVNGVAAKGTTLGFSPAREAAAVDYEPQGGTVTDHDGEINDVSVPPWVVNSSATWAYQSVNTSGTIQFSYANGQWIGYAEIIDASFKAIAELGCSLEPNQSAFAGAGGIMRKQYRLTKVGAKEFEEW